MKINYTTIRGMTSILLLVVLFITMATVHAATHIVQFGGSFGFTYSPNSMNVFVGDTIQWQGDFSMHPLSSVSIPTGATVFHQGTGTTFSYIVSTAGTYNYHCDFHFGVGMIGSFVASAVTGIKNNRISFQTGNFRLQQNYPNPFNPATIISFDIPVQAFVSINVFNIIGQKVATLVNENMAAGSYSKSWNAASLSSGVYMYRLQAGTMTETKKLVLIK